MTLVNDSEMKINDNFFCKKICFLMFQCVKYTKLHKFKDKISTLNFLLFNFNKCPQNILIAFSYFISVKLKLFFSLRKTQALIMGYTSSTIIIYIGSQTIYVVYKHLVTNSQ